MNRAPIGFFDTGVGGLSVLRAAKDILPNEDYLFLTDLKNAPYGSKDKDDILELTKRSVDQLIDAGIKALVIACNTATSAAAKTLREVYSIPIIGLEPAIKPAVEQSKEGTPIIVMATPMTLHLEKYHRLAAGLHYEGIHDVPCEGLSRLIELAGPGSDKIKEYLLDKLTPYLPYNRKSVVIGCTHFSFVSHDIKSILGEGETTIFDGREGAANQLKRVLERENLLNDSGGNIEYISTDEVSYLDLLNNFMTIPL